MKSVFKIFILLLAYACNAQGRNVVNHDLSLSRIIDSLKIDKNTISILIDKSDYRLYICSNEKIIKEYPVVFGKKDNQDKLMQGDKCTPEGKFNIISKYPHKEWSKFIWINYPNQDSWRKHNEAKKNGTIPKNAEIGGSVGIHGVPKGMDYLIDLKYNWTLGCISLKNKDVNEIYPYINKNTVIEIRK
ncbi:MAG TPA: L,D-transpeptidase [Bacteroidales bacterium]|nr:L,D-transpeptidase [Bacteroidales bacterium]